MQRLTTTTHWRILSSLLVCAAALAVHADHGPGTSGGGAATQSGETLKPGKFSIELREEFTEFESLSAAGINARAFAAGEFDHLTRSFLETVSVAYGVAENFQAGLSLGYYHAVDAQATEYDSGTGMYDTANFDPDGVTDLWLTGKYRFYRGPLGQIAVFGGIKFPTGRVDINDSNGNPVEPAATAGSGAYDGMIGLAWSRFLTSRLTLDVSGQYTIRGEYRDFQLGDRVDAGVALAWRFTEDIQQFPQTGVFFEANVRHLFKTRDAGMDDPDTGGTALFLTPGFRAAFCRNATLTLAVPVPVVQDLNGVQLETSFKITAALTVLF